MANNKLVLELIADSNNLLKAMEQSQKSINNFVRAADSAGSQLGTVNRVMSSFTNLTSGGALAAGVLAGALVAVSGSALAMAVSAGKDAEKLGQLETITGIGTDTLQDYEVALHRANLTGDDLVQVMKHMSTSLDQARQGTGSAADRFRQLGIDIRTVTSTDDLIRKIAGSSVQFANGTEKAAIMSDLLGKGWATFIKVFGGGTKAMDDAAEASKRLGATLSGGQIAELAAMDDRIDDLTTAWTRFSQQLASFVAPAVDFAAQALSNLLAMASNALKSLNSLAGINSAPDTKAKAPAFVDQAKVLERARAQADGLLKIMDSELKAENAYEQARSQLAIASVDQLGTIEIGGQYEIAKEQERIRDDATGKVIDNLNKELQAFDAYVSKKMGMYGTDEKALADKLKFEQDAEAKRAEMLNQVDLAELKSTESRIAGSKKLFDLSQQWSTQTYQDAVKNAKAIDDNQHAIFQSEAGMLGASQAARQVRFNLIMAEEAEILNAINTEAAATRNAVVSIMKDETRKSQLIEELESRRAQKIQNLELETDTKRRQTIQQFPTFFESQMQSIVASNAFSMGSMVSTWTGGIAQMAVHGGNLQAVWEQTQVAIVQATLNAGVQQLAQFGIWASQKLGLMAAEAAAEETINAAKNTEIVAGDTAAAAGSVSVWTGAFTAIAGMIETIGASIAAFFAESIIPVIVSIGEWIAGVMAAIAELMFDTIFGIPIGILLLGGIAILLGALAATGNLGFKDGGIGDFGSGTPATLHGQEAIIPLNSRGAAFMQDAMGATGGGNMTVVMQMDGREMARKTMQYMPGIVYMKTGLA